MNADPSGSLRALPSVDRLLGHPACAAPIETYGRAATLAALREALAEARGRVAGGAPVPDSEAVIGQAGAALTLLFAPSLRPVFNLTGTVLHTNLGRALLPDEAGEAVRRVLTTPCNLEYDLTTGRRGERDDHVEGLICRLTGAAAATIVNNNAAAVLLVLAALAAKREVIVSRGELVEIGGAFRIPDVMASAGCRLREVGTTNRTHLRDYAEAIGPRTAAAMKVHPSNYEIRGFTASVAAGELGGLCREHGILLLDDLGSGNLVDLSAHGLPREPTVAEAVAAADVVTFSGDKLLGGMQCGFIAGRADLIGRIRRHPLKRALRVGKETLAATEAVLRLYLDPDRLAQRLPTLRLLTRPEAEIRAQAERLAPMVAKALGAGASVRVVACASQIGSGALPVDSLPSAAISIAPAVPGRHDGRWLSGLAARLRGLPWPVVGRICNDALLLDLRTLARDEEFALQLGELPES